MLDIADDIFETFVARLDEMATEQDKNIMRKFSADYLRQDLPVSLSCGDIIQLLDERKCLHEPSNLEPLKDMFFRVGRKDFVKLAIEYKSLVTQARQTIDKSELKDCVSLTVRFGFSPYMDCNGRVEEFRKKLSDLVFLPVNHITVTRTEQLSSGGFLCVLLIHETYAGLLQDILQDKDTNSGLNYIGVTDIFMRNTTHKIKDTMIPMERLKEHQRVISVLSKQNEECVQRLDQLGKNLDSLLPLVAELGDPQTHLKNLENLHKHSGLSTTLWKVLGRLTDDQFPQKYKPGLSQEELRQKSLYSKARMERLYPRISQSLKQK